MGQTSSQTAPSQPPQSSSSQGWNRSASPIPGQTLETTLAGNLMTTSEDPTGRSNGAEVDDTIRPVKRRKTTTKAKANAVPGGEHTRNSTAENGAPELNQGEADTSTTQPIEHHIVNAKRARIRTKPSTAQHQNQSSGKSAARPALDGEEQVTEDAEGRTSTSEGSKLGASVRKTLKPKPRTQNNRKVLLRNQSDTEVRTGMNEDQLKTKPSRGRPMAQVRAKDLSNQSAKRVRRDAAAEPIAGVDGIDPKRNRRSLGTSHDQYRVPDSQGSSSERGPDASVDVDEQVPTPPESHHTRPSAGHDSTDQVKEWLNNQNMTYASHATELTDAKVTLKRKRPVGDVGDSDRPAQTSEQVKRANKDGYVSGQNSTALQEPANTPRRGVFTTEEKELADQAFEIVRQRLNVTQAQLREQIKDWANALEFKMAMIAALKGRDPTSIRRFCLRRFHNHHRGRWTEEQDKALRLAHAEHPGQWLKISEIVDRTSEDCRDRWRDYVKHSGTRETGPWSQDEELKLIAAVDDCIDVIRKCRPHDEALLNDRERLESMVDWNLVVDKLGNIRNKKQCREKYPLLKNRIDRPAPTPNDTGAVRSSREASATKLVQQFEIGDFYDVFVEIHSTFKDHSKTYHDENNVVYSIVSMKNPDSRFTVAGFAGTLRRIALETALKWDIQSKKVRSNLTQAQTIPGKAFILAQWIGKTHESQELERKFRPELIGQPKAAHAGILATTESKKPKKAKKMLSSRMVNGSEVTDSVESTSNSSEPDSSASSISGSSRPVTADPLEHEGESTNIRGIIAKSSANPAGPHLSPASRSNTNDETSDDDSDDTDSDDDESDEGELTPLAEDIKPIVESKIKEESDNSDSSADSGSESDTDSAEVKPESDNGSGESDDSDSPSSLERHEPQQVHRIKHESEDESESESSESGSEDQSESSENEIDDESVLQPRTSIRPGEVPNLKQEDVASITTSSGEEDTSDTSADSSSEDESSESTSDEESTSPEPTVKPDPISNTAHRLLSEQMDTDRRNSNLHPKDFLRRCKELEPDEDKAHNAPRNKRPRLKKQIQPM